MSTKGPLLVVLAYFITSAELVAQVFNPVKKNSGESLDTKFFKDAHGFVWLGTSEGLCRIHAKHVTFYQHDPADTHSLDDNNVQGIFTDPDNKLWIKTSNGFNLYDYNADRFSRAGQSVPSHYRHLPSESDSSGSTPVLASLEDASRSYSSPNANAPFWRISVIAACCLFLTVGLLFGLRHRKEQLRIRADLMKERLERQKENEIAESRMQFFTNASHELRTLLSLTLIPLEKLSIANEIPTKLKSPLSSAYKNALDVMKLVNDLLDVSKLEQVEDTLQVSAGECVRFISELTGTFNAVAERKQITLQVSSSLPEIHGFFDSDKLEKVIRNLISNSLKFTPQGGNVSVSIDVNERPDRGITSRYLEIAVADDGIGIAQEELPLIFNKFFQARSTASVSQPGSGLGLALAKTLVDLHHGQISVESMTGNGSTFRVRIPIDDAAYTEAERSHIADYPTSALSENSIGLSDPRIIDEETGRPEMLIIEDNEELRKMLVQEFSLEFAVTEVSSGEAGMSIAGTNIPDIIVSDIVLPGRSGLDVCRDIKADIRTSHIPVILLTAKSSTEDQIAGINAGADIYLSKPFSMRILRAQARQIIATRRTLYSKFSQDVYLMPANMTDNTVDKQFLEKAVDYIYMNLRNRQLSVDSMADLFSLSRSQVYRKIKALTGQTVVEFIRTVRLKYALKLMDERNYNLSEIADLCGFNSLSYFTRSFKDQYGKAPSEYLDGINGNQP